MPCPGERPLAERVRGKRRAARARLGAIGSLCCCWETLEALEQPQRAPRCCTDTQAAASEEGVEGKRWADPLDRRPWDTVQEQTENSVGIRAELHRVQWGKQTPAGRGKTLGGRGTQAGPGIVLGARVGLGKVLTRVVLEKVLEATGAGLGTAQLETQADPVGKAQAAQG